jgi:hypothetical protein
LSDFSSNETKKKPSSVAFDTNPKQSTNLQNVLGVENNDLKWIHETVTQM